MKMNKDRAPITHPVCHRSAHWPASPSGSACGWCQFWFYCPAASAGLSEAFSYPSVMEAQETHVDINIPKKTLNAEKLDFWKVQLVQHSMLGWGCWIIAGIIAAMQHGMEAIRLWHCWGGMEALIVAFGSPSLLGLVSHLPLHSSP